MATKTLTRPQAEALRTAEMPGHEDGIREGHPTFERYVITASSSTVRVLIRLGLAEEINGHHVVTRAGELIRATIEPGGSLPRLDMVAYTVEHTPAAEETPAPAASAEGRTLDARTRGLQRLGCGCLVEIRHGSPMWAEECVTAGELFAALVRSPNANAVQCAERDALRAHIGMEPQETSDPAPWAQKGVRIRTAGMGNGTVVRREIQRIGVKFQHAVIYHADIDNGETEWLINADSQSLARLCARCETVGDDTMPSREVNGRYLCGFCADHEDPNAPTWDDVTPGTVVVFAGNPAHRIVRSVEQDPNTRTLRLVRVEPLANRPELFGVSIHIPPHIVSVPDPAGPFDVRVFSNAPEFMPSRGHVCTIVVQTAQEARKVIAREMARAEGRYAYAYEANTMNRVKL